MINEMAELIKRLPKVLKFALLAVLILVAFGSLLREISDNWDSITRSEWFNDKSIGCSEVICATSRIPLPGIDPNVTSSKGIFIWLLKNDNNKAYTDVQFQDIHNFSNLKSIYIEEGDTLFARNRTSSGENVAKEVTNNLYIEDGTVKAKNMNVRSGELSVIVLEREPKEGSFLKEVIDEVKLNAKGGKGIYPFLHYGGDKKLEKLSILTPMAKMESHVIPMGAAIFFAVILTCFLQRAYRMLYGKKKYL